jgi:para-nitrobenzyl esterase
MLGTVAGAAAQAQVKTTGGLLQGTAGRDSSIRVFKGVPFAAPPVGDLRWQAPKPAAPWQGVRQATEVGAHCVQGPIFGDIVFNRPASEDCLFLNVWTPAKAAGERLPVMVWIHGGGFQAGAGPEPRHDGEAFARKGVVLVTLNYRLGVFGFFAHAELTKESGRNASGNYGLLDQIAALQWVKENIAAFGGDPGNVTIFGESAGSFAVSALMASPPARGLFHKAIGESGAFFTAGEQGALTLRSLAASEANGAKFAAAAGADSLAALRAKPAEDVLKVALKTQPWFAPILDGYALTQDVYAVYAAGKQSQVPLLAGWNADEIRAGIVLGQKPTAQVFTDQTRKRFGTHADAVLKVYPAANDPEALESAAELGGDMFIGYSTWKWIEMHAETGRAPVYRYSFDRKIPVAPGTVINGTTATSRDVGARHAGEIEYVFGALDSLPKVPWEPIDRTLSNAITTYWANFARTGDPNGPGVPKWPKYDPKSPRVMHLDETIRDAPDARRPRYEVLDAFMTSLRK